MAEIISRGNPVKMDFLGIEDQFGTSGKANELLEHFHLTAAEIAAKYAKYLKNKDRQTLLTKTLFQKNESRNKIICKQSLFL